MVMLSGPSSASLLFCMFSFHVPVKFGLVCAIAVNAHRGASKKAVSRDLVVIMVFVSRFRCYLRRRLPSGGRQSSRGRGPADSGRHARPSSAWLDLYDIGDRALNRQC